MDKSLTSLTLSNEINALKRKMEYLVQYQQVLYAEITEIKKHLGVQDNSNGSHADNNAHGFSNDTKTSKSRRPLNNEELDLETLQRALGVNLPNRGK